MFVGICEGATGAAAIASLLQELGGRWGVLDQVRKGVCRAPGT